MAYRFSKLIAVSLILVTIPVSPQSCPVNPPQVPFTLEYRAYIPFDTIEANNAPECVLESGNAYALYIGDSPDSTLPTGPPLTYRTSIFSVVTPNSSVPVSFVTPDTGTTYQFSMPSSPVTPPFITAADYDGIFNDCYRENLEGHASYPTNGSYSVTNLASANSVVVTYKGTVGNPLSVQAFTIGWNFQTTLTVNSASHTATVAVSNGLTGGVTCFPAHQVLVDGQTVASFLPLSRNVAYLLACLGGPAAYNLTGPATVAPGVTIGY